MSWTDRRTPPIAALAIFAAACAPAADPAFAGDSEATGGSTGAPSSSTVGPEDSSTGDTQTKVPCTVAVLDCDPGFSLSEYGCQAYECVHGYCTLVNRDNGRLCELTWGGDGSCLRGDCVISECWYDSECQESCMRGRCWTAGQCSYQPIQDGEPALPHEQSEGDCAVVVCDDGVPYESYESRDPRDDGNPCTADVCQRGGTVHLVVPEGTPCGPSGAICTEQGDCVDPCAGNLC